MANEIIDAELLAKMFLAGAQNLDANKDYINELNVFPVPDGDTGTNMTMTIMSAAKDVQALEKITMDELCKAISTGSLRGARGNSGVILSQLFRGFTKALAGVEEIDVACFANAFSKAVDTAYRAVMKPKEGTILTVAKGIATKAAELALEEDITMEQFLEVLIAHGDEVLAYTPELLPVLKQAGVVDSGGQGLMEVLKGAFDAFLGKEIQIHIEASPKAPVVSTPPRADIDTADIKFGYCTEFIVMLDKPLSDEEVDEFKAFLESIGDSIVCVADDELIKVHVHTNHPGQAFERGLTMGQLDKMKVDNMRFEHQEKLIKDASMLARQQKEAEKEKKNAQKKAYGFISVAAGEGLNEIFESLGVDTMISGGQTMNPSTDDFLHAIEKVNAETIFILPNNSNIILAAKQAADLVDDKKIIVIPTKTIPQGITAIISFDADKSPDENETDMTEEMSRVKTGQVTYAVRDTRIGDVDIAKNDIMALDDKDLIAVGDTIGETTLKLIDSMVDEETVLISVYYGEGIAQGDADVLMDEIQKKYPDCDTDIRCGGQPVYYYIVSVE